MLRKSPLRVVLRSRITQIARYSTEDYDIDLITMKRVQKGPKPSTPKNQGAKRSQGARNTETAKVANNAPANHERALLTKKAPAMGAQENNHNGNPLFSLLDPVPLKINSLIDYEAVRRKATEVEKSKNANFPTYLRFVVDHSDHLERFLSFIREARGKSTQFKDLSSIEMVNALYVYKTSHSAPFFSALKRHLADPQLPSLLTTSLMPLVGTDTIDVYASGIHNFRPELTLLHKDVDFSGLRTLGDLHAIVQGFIDHFDKVPRQDWEGHEEIVIPMVFEVNRYRTLESVLKKHQFLPIDTVDVVLNNTSIGDAIDDALCVESTLKRATESVQTHRPPFSTFKEFVAFAQSTISQPSPKDMAVLSVYTRLYASGWLHGNLAFYNDPQYWQRELDFVTSGLYKYREELLGDGTNLVYSQKVLDLIASVDSAVLEVGLSSAKQVVEPSMKPHEVQKYCALLKDYVQDLRELQETKGDYFRLESAERVYQESLLNPNSSLVKILAEIDRNHFGAFQLLLDELLGQNGGRWVHPIEELAKEPGVKKYLVSRGIMSPRQAQRIRSEYKQIPDELSVHSYEAQLLKARDVLGRPFAQCSDKEVLDAFDEFDGAIYRKAKNRVALLMEENGGCTDVLDTLLHSNSVFSMMEKRLERERHTQETEAQERETQNSETYVQLPEELALHTLEPQLRVLKDHVGRFGERTPQEVLAALDTHIEKAGSAHFRRLRNRLGLLFDINGGNTEILDTLLHSQDVFARIEKSRESKYLQIPESFAIHEYTQELGQLRDKLGPFAKSSPAQVLAAAKDMDSEHAPKLHRNLANLLRYNGGNTAVLDAVLNSSAVFEAFEARPHMPRASSILASNSQLLNSYHDVVEELTRGSDGTKESLERCLAEKEASLDPKDPAYAARKHCIEQLRSFNRDIEYYAPFLPELLAYTAEGPLGPSDVESLYIAFMEVADCEDPTNAHEESSQAQHLKSIESLAFCAESCKWAVEHLERISPQEAYAESSRKSRHKIGTVDDYFEMCPLEAARMHHQYAKDKTNRFGDVASVFQEAIKCIEKADEVYRGILVRKYYKGPQSSHEPVGSVSQESGEADGSILKEAEEDYVVRSPEVLAKETEKAFGEACEHLATAQASLAAVNISDEYDEMALRVAKKAVGHAEVAVEGAKMRMEREKTEGAEERIESGNMPEINASSETPVSDVMDALSIALNGKAQPPTPLSPHKKSSAPRKSFVSDGKINTDSVEFFLQEAKKNSDIKKESLSRQAEAYTWSRERLNEFMPSLQSNMEYMLLTLEGHELHADVGSSRSSNPASIHLLLDTLSKKEQARFNKTYSRLRSQGWELAGVRMDGHQKFVVLSRVQGGSLRVRFWNVFRSAAATTGVILGILVGLGWALRDDEVVWEVEEVEEEKPGWRGFLWANKSNPSGSDKTESER